MEYRTDSEVLDEFVKTPEHQGEMAAFEEVAQAQAQPHARAQPQPHARTRARTQARVQARVRGGVRARRLADVPAAAWRVTR
jgi:hypothetical protein